MNRSINKLNIITWLSVAVISIVFLYAFGAGVKYVTYLAIAVGFIVFVSKINTVNVQLPVIFVAIVFVHSVLIFKSNINFLVVDAPILLAIVSLAVNRYAHDIPIPIDKNYKLFMLIIVFSALISIVFSLLDGVILGNQFEAFQTRVIWLIIYFIFGLQIASYNKWGHIEWLSIVTLGLGAMQFYSVTTGTNLEALRSDVVVEKAVDVEKNWRYGGVFFNPNTLAAFFICCLPFSVRGIIEGRNILLVILYIFAVIVSLFSVLTTGSRTGLMLFVPAFLASYIYISLQTKRPDNGRGLAYLKIAIGLFLVGVMYYLYPIEFDAQLIENTFNRYDEKSNSSGEVRFEIWQCTVEKAFFTYPGGMGLDHNLFAQFVLSECPTVTEALAGPHNVLLEIFVNLGFIGLGLAILMLFKIFDFSQRRKAMRKMRSAEFMFITLFMLYGITEPLLFSAQKIDWVFAIVLGIFFSGANLRTRV